MPNLIQNPELLWFIVGLILLVSEFFVPGLVIFFFGVGAWVVALLCLLFDVPLNLQLIIFIVSSIVLLVGLRKWMTKFFTGFKSPSRTQGNIDDDSGGKAVVTKKITPEGGKVEYHGVIWSADAAEIIEEGEVVQVVKKDNLTLTVKRLL
ncbi:MAG: NfeD family protein [Deltaproteobacteria bacterium]|nr:NfeD family protein [Deltaproteobacteria bacterium]